jgi:hypothetical protein
LGSPESPDFQNPGTTALAWDINQRTANAARRAVYHHPDDDPLKGVELPPRRDHEMIIPDISGFVRG